MSGFEWRHRQGHLLAEIIEETAEEITINYQHVTDMDWGGIVTLSKPVFEANYSLTPQNGSAGDE